jgi:hypothetical protein
MWRAFAILILTAGAALGAPSPEDLAAAKVHNQDIVSRASGIDGVFVLQDDGTIKHLQSGMICPGYFQNVQLWHLEVFKSDAGAGADVGCDYGRNDAGGHWVSKLTIFATRAPDGTTLDQAFARYRAEILQAAPDAQSRGEALHDDTKPQDRGTLSDYRSEEFVTQRDGRTCTDDLYVVVHGGWMMEIRSTYIGLPNQIDLEPGDPPDTAVLMTGDRIMGPSALLAVSGTIGH